MRKCEYLRTPYTRLRRICPRHVSPVPVLCGERMAGKLADSPTTLCGNPILGHIEINGRAVVVEVSAASHDVRYLSWEGGLVAMATRWAGSLESIWVGAKRQITSISFTLATLPLDHGWMPPLYCPSHLFWQTVTEWSLCGAHIINTPRGKHDYNLTCGLFYLFGIIYLLTKCFLAEHEYWVNCRVALHPYRPQVNLPSQHGSIDLRCKPLSPTAQMPTF